MKPFLVTHRSECGPAMRAFPRKRARGYANNAAQQLCVSSAYIVKMMMHFELRHITANLLACQFEDARFNYPRNNTVLSIARRTLVRNLGARLIGDCVRQVEAVIETARNLDSDAMHLTATTTIYLNDTASISGFASSAIVECAFDPRELIAPGR